MITIYTKNNCSFCVKAKALLKNQDIAFTEVKIGSDILVESVKELFPTARTAPIITVGDVYIGGFDQLVTYLAENKEEDDNSLLLG